MKHTFGTLIIMLATVITAAASEVTDSARLLYRQGSSKISLNLPTNASSIDSLINLARHRPDAPSAVTVIGSASPEGSVAINASLSHRRANGIFHLLSDSLSLPDSITSFTFTGRDWQGLTTMVEADRAVPSRNEVLSLLSEINASLAGGEPDNETNLSQLKSLAGGRPYAYMYATMFPALRRSSLVITYPTPLSPAPSRPSALALCSGELPGVKRFAMPEVKKPFYMALKTNMLFDALALPNIGVEFYLGRKWSAAANWMYGWWDKDRSHHYWRAYGGDITVRRWFGSKAEAKPLTGHHLGVYAGVVTYDFEFGGKGWMGGIPGRTLRDRANINAGIEYGYSLPVGRRLNIDFTIGIGYLGGKVVHYVPADGYYLWQKTKRLNWVGPTKAEISLVWLIGRGNYNANK